MKRKVEKNDRSGEFSSKEYMYSVVWSDEDSAYVARVVEFPSLAAHGSTAEEALKEMREVLESVLDDLRENSEPVPAPFGRKHFSGKLNLRMPPHLHRQLTIEAARERVSLNQWINMKLGGEIRLKA